MVVVISWMVAFTARMEGRKSGHQRDKSNQSDAITNAYTLVKLHVSSHVRGIYCRLWKALNKGEFKFSLLKFVIKQLRTLMFADFDIMILGQFACVNLSCRRESATACHPFLNRTVGKRVPSLLRCYSGTETPQPSSSKGPAAENLHYPDCSLAIQFSPIHYISD